MPALAEDTEVGAYRAEATPRCVCEIRNTAPMVKHTPSPITGNLHG